MAEDVVAPRLIIDGVEQPPAKPPEPPCTTCEGDKKKKKKEMSPAVKEMIKGMPPDQQALVEKSPALQAKLEALHDKGWTVNYTNDKGAWADRGSKTIVLGSGYQNVSTLSHEAGHAMYNLPDAPSVHGITQSERTFVDQSVQRNFGDEGAAQFSTGQTRADILKDGGPDIGFGNGAGERQYRNIYGQYETGTLTQQQATTQMGSQFGMERTSTTGQSYTDYYGGAAQKTWDSQATIWDRSRSSVYGVFGR